MTVAVTGIGVVSGFGHGVGPFWQGLVDGASSLAPIRRFEVPPHASLGAEVPPLDTRALVHSPIGRRIDWVSLMALAACRLALADAGLEPPALAPERTALALEESLLPPTAGLRAPDPAWADLDLVPLHGRRAPLGVAVSSSYGFGGHNVTLVLARPERAR